MGFQPVRQARPPPHHQLFGGTSNSHSNNNFSKYSQKFSSNKQAVLDYKFIKSAYDQIPNLSVKRTDKQMTSWLVAKHLHHAPDFDLDPVKFGMTQDNLDDITKNGLPNYIKNGGTPPNKDFVKALQKRRQRFVERKSTTAFEDQTVFGRKSSIKKHPSGLFVSFDNKAEFSSTGYRLNSKQSDKQLATGTI